MPILQILELPSKLFYENKLICKADLPKDGPVHIRPLQFISVDGKEEQSEDSPSFYNFLEAITIVEQVYNVYLVTYLFFISSLMKVEKLTSGGLPATDICVLAYYKQQIQLIRHELKKKRLGKVTLYCVLSCFNDM